VTGNLKNFAKFLVTKALWCFCPGFHSQAEAARPPPRPARAALNPGRGNRHILYTTSAHPAPQLIALARVPPRRRHITTAISRHGKERAVAPALSGAGTSTSARARPTGGLRRSTRWIWDRTCSHALLVLSAHSPYAEVLQPFRARHRRRQRCGKGKQNAGGGRDPWKRIRVLGGLFACVASYSFLPPTMRGTRPQTGPRSNPHYSR